LLQPTQRLPRGNVVRGNKRSAGRNKAKTSGKCRQRQREGGAPRRTDATGATVEFQQVEAIADEGEELRGNVRPRTEWRHGDNLGSDFRGRQIISRARLRATGRENSDWRSL
jgi:Ni/Co efflux regulator RcnB